MCRYSSAVWERAAICLRRPQPWKVWIQNSHEYGGQSAFYLNMYEIGNCFCRIPSAFLTATCTRYIDYHITNILLVVSSPGLRKSQSMFRVYLRLCFFKGWYFLSLDWQFKFHLWPQTCLVIHVCLFDHGTNLSFFACVWVSLITPFWTLPMQL